MSRLAYPTHLRDNLGNEVRLPSKPFAIGGEGAVFDVLGRPGLVAKLYSKPQSNERCDKLRAMAKLCSPDLLKIAAWPTATLSNGDPAVVDGILMPRIMGHLEIHHLYSVAQRKKDFPEADWGFLLHTARNCAIAFEAVHQRGHVVGDVNQKNVMVSKKGIVALVDCDSFQVAEGTRIFRCGVGVPEYTPPELHGKNFASLDRAANHDLFGLAVLVFHLLMMGRHPFSGVPLVSADIPIGKAIQDGLYAYTRNPTKLKPPPHVPPLTMLDGATLDLFERAFGSTRRPAATEWRVVLDAAMKQLQRCKNDPKHSYLPAAGNCPWCQLIAVARLMFFIPGQGAATPFRPEDIEQLIRKLGLTHVAFAAYVRPRPILPVHISLPPGLRSIQRPILLPHPAPPTPVQKPVLAPVPPPPISLPVPQPQPSPPSPMLVQRPPLTLRPVTRPVPKPPLMPHPSAPSEPPRPIFHPIPRPPTYPPMPEPGPPDPFLARACIAGVLAGLPVLLIASPVGVIIMFAFGTWWVTMKATENTRRELARKSLRAAYKFECARMYDEYADLCQPIEAENKRMADAWEAEKSALTAKYQKTCKRIDDENYRQLAAWEAADSVRRADHARVCASIDAANGQVLAAWEAKNAAITSTHQRESDEIARANRRVLADWAAENASRQAAHDRARHQVENENQRLTSAWETLKATRQSEHERACREVDAKNHRLIAGWEAANAPWLAEEKRWRDRAGNAEVEILRLESDLIKQRAVTESRFRQRKDEASGIAASHGVAKADYERELGQAELDSEKIQLEEHLDKALIRHAKLEGISGYRILSLESFGIETAKDVPLLHTQKVPGIGPALSRRLFDWRDGLMASFRPQQALPESEKNRIASRYAPVMLPLGQAIQAAINDLDTIAMSHRAREAEMIKAIAAAVQNFAIAEAHVNGMKVI
jgi:DNA-binding helix-hairpin-helix protein with protein kinase domain